MRSFGGGFGLFNFPPQKKFAKKGAKKEVNNPPARRMGRQAPLIKMKKFLSIAIGFLAGLFVVSIIVAGYFYFENKKAAREANQAREGLKTFESRMQEFKLDYPDNLYLETTDGSSVLPTFVRLSEVEDKDNLPTDFSFYDLNIYESEETKDLKKIDDYSYVNEFIKNNYQKENLNVSGEPAVKLTNSEKIGEKTILIYLLHKQKVYLLSLIPSTAAAYEKSKGIFDKVINGFEFITPTAAYKGDNNRAYAASACDTLDQYYTPSSFIYSEPVVTAATTGQTFKPTKNSICRIDFELEQVTAGTMTVWLYKGAQNLAQKTINVANGWNTAVLDNAVSVTPEAEYIIYLSVGSAAGRWKGGEVGSGGTYARGHAIIGGFNELDFDFHFREYASASTTTTPTPTPKKSGAPTASGTPSVTPSEPTAVLVEPSNLHILELRLTGVAESYVDLEWDKSTDENFAGYILYYGETEGQDYYYAIDVGTVNNMRVANLIPAKDYYFVLKVYDKFGNLSKSSNEVKASLLKRYQRNWWWLPALLALLLLGAIIWLIILNRKKKNSQEHSPMIGEK